MHASTYALAVLGGCRCNCQSSLVKRSRLPLLRQNKSQAARPNHFLQARHASTSAHNAAQPSRPDLQGKPFKLAIVGSGPAGFYAASRVLSANGSENAQVHMYEELPVPFGLVRYGVAPDHPEVKNCIHKFEETAQDYRFRYFGNVKIGKPQGEDLEHDAATGAVRASTQHALNIPLDFLKQYYHAVLFTFGASHDRSLGPGVKNDDAVGILHTLSARSFVHWYNGHPHSPFHAQGMKIDLAGLRTALIIGQGNVALDCARILLSGREPPTIDRLSKTDVPESVLADLAKSSISHVDIAGRRGPLQFAGTTKELRELVNLDFSNVTFALSPEDRLAVSDAVKALDDFTSAGGKAESARMKKRLLQLMQKAVTSTPKRTMPQQGKTWTLSFCQSPIAIEGASADGSRGPVRRVTFEQNDLLPVAHSTMPSNELVDPTSLMARGTGITHTKEADLLLKSVGYRSVGIAGLPFDNRKGVVPNEEGRVLDERGNYLPGLYVSGWLARGPNGVIATTMYDAFQTADTIVADFGSSHTREDMPELPRLDEAGFGQQRTVSWQDWQAIDAKERKRGASLGKEREKFVTIDEMLECLE